MTRLNFDPALPELPVIDDADTVASLLTPGRDVVRVRRQDTKYVPGVSCVAAFEVRTGGSESVLGAINVTPDGVVGYAAANDPALPSLAPALDETQMRRRLASVDEVGADVRLVHVTPVRYKPGVRCVLRYDVTTATGPETFYGKLLSGDGTAEVSIARALGNATAAHAEAPLVLPVTAHWPDLGMMLQPALRDTVELHDQVTDARMSVSRRGHLFARAGRALAGLHSTWLPELRRRDLADDLTELREHLRVAERADPACADRFVAVIDRLAAVADEAADAPVTTHGAFRTDQFLVAGEDMVLIDLDTVCRAEAACDLGNVLAYLDWKRIRHPRLADTVSDISQSFLSGYADVRPLPSAARLAACRATSLAKIAGRRLRSLTTAEWPLIPDLLSASALALMTPEVHS